jgi:hypothetical protein
LILAGDIDATGRSLERFAAWPVPVLMVAGSHESTAANGHGACVRCAKSRARSSAEKGAASA